MASLADVSCSEAGVVARVSCLEDCRDDCETETADATVDDDRFRVCWAAGYCCEAWLEGHLGNGLNSCSFGRGRSFRAVRVLSEGGIVVL